VRFNGAHKKDDLPSVDWAPHGKDLPEVSPPLCDGGRRNCFCEHFFDLAIPEDVVNVEGNSIAQGHPIGAIGPQMTKYMSFGRSP
jgi:hypothetical protein